jgi:hypothetical protein
MKRSTIVYVFVAVSALFIYGCAGKEGPTGPAGPAGQPGPSAQYFDTSFVFTAGSTYCYCGLVPRTNYLPGDVVIVYWKEFGTEFFVQIPYLYYATANIWPEINPGSSTLFINTTTPDGTGHSPWTTNKTLSFRIVVIKAIAVKSAPKINYGNYQEVKRYYDFSD